MPEYASEEGYVYPEWEHEKVLCPECGSDKLYSMPRQFGPDDYVKQTECRGCGSTWEN